MPDSPDAPAKNPDPAATAGDAANDSLAKLSPSQCEVLTRLAEGASIIDAANAAGVSHRSLRRWLHEDAHFTAAFNAWRRDLLESAQARALAMGDAALTAIAAAIQNGNVQAAMQLVKSLGILKPAAPQPTDADEVARRRTIDNSRRESRLAQAEFRNGLGPDPSHNGEKLYYDMDAFIKKLNDHEQRVLLCLRAKMHDCLKDPCGYFLPTDGGRELSNWEIQAIENARARLLATGQYTIKHGEPWILPYRNGEPVRHTRKELMEIIIADGVDPDEAARALAKYPEDGRSPYEMVPESDLPPIVPPVDDDHEQVDQNS